MQSEEWPVDILLTALRAAAEPSRLRLLAICAQGEWTVSELTQIMAQSQPRISRHLKLLAEAGLLDRFREGSWVFYRRAQQGPGARLARGLCRQLPESDPALLHDRRRMLAVRETRREAAERFFDAHAERWDSEQNLAVDGAEVETALAQLIGGTRPESLLDIGTGTGHILQILAPRIGFGLGIDRSHDMLRLARARLDRQMARNCQVRHGDMYHLPLGDGTFEVVTLHQVLHFADDPPAVLAEARRVLRPGGRLIVIDLAQHAAEWLRSERAHRRLGFSEAEIGGWMSDLGLEQAPSIVLPGDQLTATIWCATLPESATLLATSRKASAA